MIIKYQNVIYPSIIFPFRSNATRWYAAPGSDPPPQTSYNNVDQRNRAYQKKENFKEPF